MLMIEDSRLKIFRAVVEEESFTLAAARLGISQPAVSQNIAELEKAVGRKLFLRNRYTVQLNEDGVAFNEYASQIEYWYGALNAAFQSEIPALPGRKRTRLTIGIDETFDPHFVPSGSPEADIDIAKRGSALYVTAHFEAVSRKQ
jgi:DNA-binding transcriptional LysR family regulator